MTLLIVTRNRLCTEWQYLVGTLLMAYSASTATFDFMSRMNVSVSQSAIYNFMSKLADSARERIKLRARLRHIYVIYDNINRRIAQFDPDADQRHILQSGTAQIFVVLYDNPEYDPNTFDVGLDPAPLNQAYQEQRRKGLNYGVLHNRVKFSLLERIWAMQCLLILADRVGPRLDHLKKYAQEQLSGPLSQHPMTEKGRKTEF